jgi:hypothetical protein
LYDVPDLGPGQYVVDLNCFGLSNNYADQWFNKEPSAGTADIVSAGPGDVAVINAVLHPGGSISGVVTAASGRKLKGVCVGAVNSRDRTNDFGAFGGPSDAITNSRGAYRLTNLAAGSYRVVINTCPPSRYGQQWYRGKLTLASATPVRVRADRDTTGINARLSVGGSISGRVTNAAGKPLKGVCVIAVDAAAFSVELAITGSAGRYSIRGLNTGVFTVYLEQCTNNTPVLVPVARTVRVVAPKARSGVNAVLRPGGSVAGHGDLRITGCPPCSRCLRRGGRP